MRCLFLTPANIAAIEKRGEGSVCRDLRAGFYRGATGGGERPWRISAEKYEAQFGLPPGSTSVAIREDEDAGRSANHIAAFAENFWSRVDRSAGPDACWPYSGAPDTCGYGRHHYGGQKLGAHRVAANLALGISLNSSVSILHSCDNPPCCNPAHLRAGTHAENMRDRNTKGRAAKGAANGRCRISEETARLLIQDFAEGKRCAAVARERGVPYLAAREIKRGRTWKHLPRASK